MRSGPSGQLKVLWCVADVWHQALGERPVCHSCVSPVDDSDAHAEYKQVTVLFADVVHSMDIASVVGAKRLREIMAALVDRAAVVVQGSEGTVGGFTGDGIMVVLGGRP
jgi:adenylate cyclase